MELETYIRESISQIVNGVKAAQEDVKGTGAIVNPAPMQPIVRAGMTGAVAVESIQNIEFEVLVSAVSENKAGGDAKVGKWVLSVGIEGSTASETASHNKLQFSVPVSYPFTE